MLSAFLVTFVEQHADSLTDALVNDLMTNAQTPSFHSRSRDDVRHTVHNIYHGLGKWLADTPEHIGFRSEAYGVQQYADGSPLSEHVYAVILMKQHLREAVRSIGNVYSALELHNEIQLNVLIGRFFDRMLYGIVKGYEQAAYDAVHPQRPATRAKAPLGKSAAKIEWVP